MSEKIIICIGMSLLMLFLPYGLTMLMTGYDKQQGTIRDSGIIVEYEIAGELKTADLEQYMIGVLLAELPYDYELAVYEAQAVITRTNARKLHKAGSNLLAQDLKVAYATEEDMKKQLGQTRYEEQLKKVKTAIGNTYGMVLTYGGNYIDALYHNVSMGQTASALDVYGKDIPYLTSVDSSADVEAKDYMQTVTFSYEQLVALIGDQYGLTQENFLTEIAISEKSDAGYVKQVKLGTGSVTGEELKQLLSLNSLYFYMENQEDQLKIVCLGKGHGLGLSWYGANQMAKQGKDVREILTHYYQGASVEKIGE